jgi:hypothetical protein
MGYATDARESEDFRRVRALPGWPAVEELIEARGRDGAPAKPLPPPERAVTAPAVVKPASPAAAAPKKPAVRDEEALILGAAPLDPIAIAYDGASRRFVVGDRRANRLIVADEVFNRVSDLIGVSSAGLGLLDGFEIDSRRGDLWVSSSPEPGVSSVHKLQLVSGRVLSTIRLPDEMRPVTISDMSITDAGALLLVDAAGSRLLTIKAGSHNVGPLVRLSVRAPASLAPSGNVVYVAHEDGLSALDLKSGRVREITAPNGITLAGFRRLRFHRGSLVAIQADPGAETDRLVRVRLARGGARVAAVEPLDDGWASDGSALTIAREAAYYVARTGTGPIIRRVPLR